MNQLFRSLLFRSLLLRLMTASIILLSVSGCSTIYRTTGWFAYDFAETYAFPYMMTTDDTQMSCSMGDSLTPLLMSFSQLTETPNRLAISLYMQAGACAESKANEEELSYIRAYQSHNIAEAKDARIRQKRLFSVAAKRQYKSYQYLVAEFGEPGEICPELDDTEQFFWMVGLISGLQSVINDLRGEGNVGVPKDIAMKSVRGSQCLDNKRWWGLPNAMQAAAWTIMPDSKPEGVDPWKELEKASAIASESGVRLAHAVEVMMANGSGGDSRLRDAIRRHSQSIRNVASNPEYKMLDIISTQQILAVSDRLWTEATGSRTPINGLGTFWDDSAPETEALDINDLLGD